VQVAGDPLTHLPGFQPKPPPLPGCETAPEGDHAGPQGDGRAQSPGCRPSPEHIASFEQARLFFEHLIAAHEFWNPFRQFDEPLLEGVAIGQRGGAPPRLVLGIGRLDRSPQRDVRVAAVHLHFRKREQKIQPVRPERDRRDPDIAERFAVVARHNHEIVLGGDPGPLRIGHE